MACCVVPSAKAAVAMTATKAVVHANFNMSVLPLKVCLCLALSIRTGHLRPQASRGTIGSKSKRGVVGIAR
jgi:hypothetical protein